MCVSFLLMIVAVAVLLEKSRFIIIIETVSDTYSSFARCAQLTHRECGMRMHLCTVRTIQVSVRLTVETRFDTDTQEEYYITRF